MKIKATLTVIAVLWVAATTGVVLVQSEEIPRVSEEGTIQVDLSEPKLGKLDRRGNHGAIDAVDEPREKSEAIKIALSWLVSRQQDNGGWGPGHVAAGAKERTTVGNTCIALQALARDGNTPIGGTYKKEVAEAIDYVLAAIEEADAKSLFVSPIRDSQLQRKLGTYVDTFMAASILPEFKGKMGSKKGEAKLHEGVKKLLAKIEANQAEDGSWKDTGWAPTLSQGFAGKSINRAAQKGWKVDEEVRERAEEFTQGNFDRESGTFSGEGSAGIALYSNASNLQQIQDSAFTNRQLVEELEEQVATSKDEKVRMQAEAKLQKIAKCEEDLEAARKAVIKRLEDPNFVAGFGNNGGEEFLSYVNIGESLRDEGGEVFARWNEKMSDNMCRTQSTDGCWKGQHCITGGTFCTSTGLLVLMMDKPVDEAGSDT